MHRLPDGSFVRQVELERAIREAFDRNATDGRCTFCKRHTRILEVKGKVEGREIRYKICQRCERSFLEIRDPQTVGNVLISR